MEYEIAKPDNLTGRTDARHQRVYVGYYHDRRWWFSADCSWKYVKMFSIMLNCVDFGIAVGCFSKAIGNSCIMS